MSVMLMFILVIGKPMIALTKAVIIILGDMWPNRYNR
jgi:hypothetical protein